MAALPSIDRRPFLQLQVDTVEAAAASEHLLRRVDVHHRQVAAERARQPARFHDAAHGERLVADHRGQGQLAAHGQAVALRKFLGDDDRIGLRQKHQRIVDDGFVAALQVVVPQAAVARHVDAQNQDVPLARNARGGGRLDHGNGHCHFRHRLHFLQDLLGKSRLAGGHLQLRGAGDAIHRPLEGEEHRLVGGMHRHEHRHAQHDAQHGEERPHRVLPEIRPADERQQSHSRFPGFIMSRR